MQTGRMTADSRVVRRSCDSAALETALKRTAAGSKSAAVPYWKRHVEKRPDPRIGMLRLNDNSNRTRAIARIGLECCDLLQASLHSAQ